MKAVSTRIVAAVGVLLLVVAAVWTLGEDEAIEMPGESGALQSPKPPPQLAGRSGSSVLVSVIGADGMARADAEACVVSPGGGLPNCSATDAAGRVTLDVSPGSWDVYAMAPLTCGVQATRISVAQADDVEVDVVIPDSTCTVTGTVRDVFGGEIAGGVVQGLGTRSLTTEDGRFCVCAPAGALILGFEAPGYLESRVRVGAPASDLVVTLEPAATVAGRVRWSDGSVAADAWVNVSTRNGRIQAHANREGRFEVSNVTPGRIEVRAAHPEGRSHLGPALYLGPGGRADDLELVLIKATHVSGTLLVGEAVCEAGEIRMIAQHGQVEPAPAQVAADGGFRILGVDPGTYQLQLKCDEPGGSNLKQSVEVKGPMEDARWVIESCGRSVSGTVVDGTGRPVDGFRVQADRDGRRLAQATTDDEGAFSLSCLDDGEVRVSVPFSSGQGPEAVVEVGNSDVENLKIELSELATVEGRVLFPEGEAAQSGTVRLRPSERGAARLLRVDADGTIAGGAMLPGGYRASLQGDDGRIYPLERVEPSPLFLVGGTQTELALSVAPRGESLRGTVADPADRPIAAAVVTASDDSGTLASATTDLSGAFTLERLPEGSLLLVVRTRDGESAQTRVSLPSEEPVRVELIGRRTVHGTVVSGAGRAPDRFLVDLVEPDGRRTEWFEGTSGAFTLDVSRGEVVLAVSAGTRFGRVQLSASDEEERTVAVELQEKRRVCGRVTDATGSAVSGVYVLGETLGNRASSRSDADGRFELELPSQDSLSLRFLPGPRNGKFKEVTKSFADPGPNECSVGDVVLE